MSQSMRRLVLFRFAHRPVSCTYCHIMNLSITTTTFCIAQKMQEAERIYNQHVHNVDDTLYSR